MPGKHKVKRIKDDKALRPAKAASLLGVGTPTLRRWLMLGLIKAEITPRGHARYRESEVERLIDATR